MSDTGDIDRRVWKLFVGYVHGTLSRREFLDRAAKLTATGVSAATLLATLSPDYALARQVDPSLILLDLMLPGLDGLTVCRRLRESNEFRNIPIIMVTAKNQIQDLVEGLSLHLRY